MFKMYVSPVCERISEAFQTTVAVASRFGAHSLKVGKDVYGLLRPDKIVVYFPSRQDLEAAADCFIRELEGCPGHGVPFAADLSDNGLLAWGADPPRETQVIPWQERESWRLWITNRLASALVTAKAGCSGSDEACRFALTRVRLQGVDPGTWMPIEGAWNYENEREA
jgi:hypothetical protein